MYDERHVRAADDGEVLIMSCSLAFDVLHSDGVQVSNLGCGVSGGQGKESL